MKSMLQQRKERVVTFLDRKEVDFLDKLGKDALFSTGAKISRAKLLEWLVDILKKHNLSGENIKSEKDFEKRIRGSVPPATEGKITGGAR